MFIFSMVEEYISSLPLGVCSAFFTGSARKSAWRTHFLASGGTGMRAMPSCQNFSKGVSLAALLAL